MDTHKMNYINICEVEQGGKEKGENCIIKGVKRLKMHLSGFNFDEISIRLCRIVCVRW